MNQADIEILRQLIQAVTTGSLPDDLTRHQLAGAVEEALERNQGRPGLRQDASIHIAVLSTHLRGGWALTAPELFSAVEEVENALTRYQGRRRRRSTSPIGTSKPSKIRHSGQVSAPDAA